MTGRYDQEFNRTMPEQTEGPEFTPYVNKGKGKKTKFKMPVVVATLVGAAILFGLFSSSLGLESVGTADAVVSCDITKESPTDVIEYVLYENGTAIASGELDEGHTEIPFEGLIPDTPYTFEVLKNGNQVDTLNFKTLPAGGSVGPSPGPDPGPGPEPEPELTEMTFDSLGGQYYDEDGRIVLDPAFTLNDSTVDSVEILLGGSSVAFTEENGRYYPGIEAEAGKTYDFTVTVHYTTGEETGELSKAVSVEIPEKEPEPVPPPEEEEEEEPALTDMTFDSLEYWIDEYGNVALFPSFTMNDSTIDSTDLLIGADTVDYAMEGVYYLPYMEIAPGDSVTFTMLVHFTTGDVQKQTSKSVTVDIPLPDVDPPTVLDTSIVAEDFTLWSPIRVNMNGNTFRSATISSADGVHVFALDAQSVTDESVILVPSDGIDMLYDEPDDIFETIDWGAQWEKPMTLSLEFTDPGGTDAVMDTDISVLMVPQLFANGYTSDESEEIIIEVYGIPDGGWISAVEFYGSDDENDMGQMWLYAGSPIFEYEADGDVYIGSFTYEFAGLYYWDYITPVVCVTIDDSVYRITLYSMTI